MTSSAVVSPASALRPALVPSVPVSVPALVPALTPVLVPVDPDVPDDDLTIDQLGSRIVGLAGRLAAATCRWLLLVADFDARDGWSKFGLPCTARWLSHCCGISHRTAVEHVRVARALATFPELAAAMRSGRLSYSHARAIARLAREGERELVADLVVVAEHGTVGQLETLVRGLRTADSNDPDDPDVLEEYVRHSWTSASQWRLNARFDAERGAVLQAAIEQVARAEGITQAAALIRLAEIGLAATADSAAAPRPLRGDERAAVLIHLDAGALPAIPCPDDASDDGRDAPHATSAGRGPHSSSPDDTHATATSRARRRAGVAAWIRHGPGLPTRVVERLLCSGRVRTAVIAAGNNPLDVGRTRRVVTDRQFRALLLRDGGCRYPGCGSAHRLEAHHVWHWLYGGASNMANLVLLCERHHLAHHNGDFSIESRGPTFVFRRADGRELQEHIDPCALADAGCPVDAEHDVAGDAARGSRSGDRFDRHYAVAVLARARSDARPPTERPATERRSA